MLHHRRRGPYRATMTRPFVRFALAAAALPLLAVPVAAQDAGSPMSPAPAPDPAAAVRQEAQRQLTAALARIAGNGADVQALTQAGRAALTLGDARAALGFLARAEQLAPRDPVIKAALGATMVQLEDPAQAMRFFESAIALGGLERAYLADRGLAYDLLGDQPRAQADYAAAALYAPSPEVTRRHAISLGISGNSEQAVQLLGPLLRAQDRAAWRSRAMIVAMNGRADEARQIAAATMPAQLANGLSPYFAMMERLTPTQLASAAHFGRFPSYEVVAAQPVRAARRVEVAAATTPPPPARGNDGRRGRRVVASNGPAAPRNPPRERGARQPAPQPVRPTPTPVPVPPVRVVEAAPPVVAGAGAVAASPAPAGPVVPSPAPQQPVQPVMQQTLRPTIITPTPASPPAQPALVAAAPMGPPDGGQRPGLAALPPVTPDAPPAAPPAQPAIAAVDLPPASIQPAVPSPAVPAAPVTPVPVTPAPVAPPANTTVVAGWSLADMVGSITVPDSERRIDEGALSIEELDRIAEARRRAAAAEAVEARRRAAEEARTRETASAEARARAEREAEQRAEAEARRRHPARIWVQVATGADAGALAGDYRRFSQRNAEIFRGQTGHTVAWNRTRRLVVGPFPNAAAARTWLNRYVAAGGEGFVWNSSVGEEVVPVGRR